MSHFILISLFLLLHSTVSAQNFQPIIGVEYNNFYTVFHTIGGDAGVTYKEKIDISLLYNYYWYYNKAATYDKSGLGFNSLGSKLSYRPLKSALSPRIELSYSKGMIKTNDGLILAYSGFPITVDDTSSYSYSYLGKFESLRWNFKIGGGLDYSWKNFNVYLGLGYQWWEFNINRNFYHAYFWVSHKGWYYNAHISYRFGKNEKN